jgi:hypothetical protein
MRQSPEPVEKTQVARSGDGLGAVRRAELVEDVADA